MGLSTCAKAWIACGVCTAVVLAVMIPVTMLVIVPDVAPGMGQNALDDATMTIPKSTTVGYDPIESCMSCSTITNQVVINQDSLPLSAKLHESDLVMHLPDGTFADPTPVDLGWFRMPEQTIKHGSNSFGFESNLTVFDSSTLVLFGFGFAGPDKNANVYIVGKPTMTVLWGVTFPLKLGKKMNCTFHDTWDSNSKDEAGDPLESEEYVAARRLGVSITVRLSCAQLGNLEESEIDSILAKFSNETSTTPAPAPTTSTTTTSTTPSSGPNVV